MENGSRRESHISNEELKLGRLILMRQHFDELYPERVEESDFLKSWQKDTIDGFKNCLDQKIAQYDPTIRAAMIQSMGCGKTVEAAEILNLCGVGRIIGGRRVRAIWTAPELQILNNVDYRSETEKRGVALVNPNISVTRMGKGYNDNSGDIVVMSSALFDKEWSKHEEGLSTKIPFDEFDIYVCDEPDAYLGYFTSSLPSINKAIPISIALTATPQQRKHNILDHWPEVISYITPRQAIENYGVLGENKAIQFFSIESGQSLKINKLDINGELSDYQLDKLLGRREIQELAFLLCKALTEEGLKTAVFTHSGKKSLKARELAERLNNIDLETGQRKIIAKAVGKFATESADILTNFQNSQTDVLISCKMGEIGWDPGNLNAVLNLTPVLTSRLPLQRFGRLFHNKNPDDSLMAIFVRYNLIDKYGQPVEQLSPEELFDLEHGETHLIFNPSAKIRRQELKGGISDFRRKNPRPPTPKKNKQENPEPETPTFFQNFNLTTNLKNEGKFIYRDDEPGFSLDYVANLSGMDVNYLARILRAEGKKVRSRTKDSKRNLFCEEEDIASLDDLIAKKEHYSLARIQRILKVSNAAASAALRKIKNESFEPEFTMLYGREPNRIAIKRKQYSKETLFAIGKITSKKVRLEKSLVPSPVLVELTQRDPATIHKRLTELGYIAEKRRIGRDPNGTWCYRLSPEMLENITSWLKKAPELPREGTFENSSQISSRFLRIYGFTREDIDELLKSRSSFDAQRYSMKEGKEAWFLKEDKVQNFVQFVKDEWLYGRLTGSRPSKVRHSCKKIATLFGMNEDHVQEIGFLLGEENSSEIDWKNVADRINDARSIVPQGSRRSINNHIYEQLVKEVSNPRLSSNPQIRRAQLNEMKNNWQDLLSFAEITDIPLVEAKSIFAQLRPTQKDCRTVKHKDQQIQEFSPEFIKKCHMYYLTLQNRKE